MCESTPSVCVCVCAVHNKTRLIQLCTPESVSRVGPSLTPQTGVDNVCAQAVQMWAFNKKWFVFCLAIFSKWGQLILTSSSETIHRHINFSWIIKVFRSAKSSSLKLKRKEEASCVTLNKSLQSFITLFVKALKHREFNFITFYVIVDKTANKGLFY